MDTFRKWLNKPKADDKSLLARFYHADRSLTAVASELDSFDGRAEPDRCSRLVSRLRQGQDKVLAITSLIMEELLGEDRDPRAFRSKFPEEVLQENLAGQLWFGAECLAAGSSIMNREQESKEMRPLAQAVTKSLGNVRNLLRDQCLRNNVPNSQTLHLDLNDSGTEQLYESLKIFDRLFAEFELRYVSAMVQVKTKHEYEMQEMICVLFSETLQRALTIGLLDQDKVDAFDPALMFSIPRLAIISGLVIFAKGPLNMDMSAEQLSEMFRPFRTILIKIRDHLRTLSKSELYQLEKLLCTNEDIHMTVPVGTSSIEAPSPDQQNNNDIINTTYDDNTNANQSTEQRIQNINNNNNNNNNNNIVDIAERQSTSTSPKRVLETANNTNNINNNNNNNTTSTITTRTTDAYVSRFAARSTSNSSSVSPDSSVHSSPTASPFSSPTPSIASTSSAISTASTSADDWTDNDDDAGNDIDEDDIAANIQVENELDSDSELDGELPKEQDIVYSDCASGYLIPNTNFGNLLQPQEVPLTDNFIASEDELHEHQDEEQQLEDVDVDLPTTSSCLRRSHMNSNNIKDQQMTIINNNSNNNIEQNCEQENSACSTASAHCTSKKRSCSSSASRSNTNHSHHHHHHHNAHSRRNGHHHHHHHHHHHRNYTNRQQHHHHHHIQAHFQTRTNRHHRYCKSDDCTERSTINAIDDDRSSASTTKSLPTPNKDTSTHDTSTSSSLSDGDQHNSPLSLRETGRMKFKNTENLLHRLFVCIAGVADQLQTNFASDLRHILRSVFLMNMSMTEEEIDIIPDKPKETELFEFRASENDVIQQQSAGSNQSIYSAEEVNPELDNVFTNTNSNGNRHSAGATIQRGNTIDLCENDSENVATHRQHSGRSRSLGDQDSPNISDSNSRLSTYIGGCRNVPSTQQASILASNRHRNRNNSVGSNSPSIISTSSSSSESNSPRSERSTTTIYPNSNSNRNNNNNSSNNNVLVDATAASAVTTTRTSCLAPPAWIPDDKAPRCMSCQTAFTAFRRRHHCRNCGGVFCGLCSNSSAPLPKYGLTKAVRVCRTCYVREVLFSVPPQAPPPTPTSPRAVNTNRQTAATTAGS